MAGTNLIILGAGNVAREVIDIVSDINNDKFFTDDFLNLRTVYPNYEVLVEKIVSDIKDLDNEVSYVSYQTMQFNMCAKYYNYKSYIDNLSSFYQRYFCMRKE